MADCDPNKMEESEEAVGPLDGKLRVVLMFHRSTSGFKYHLNAKHVFVGGFYLRCDPWLSADHSHQTQGIM